MRRSGKLQISAYITVTTVVVGGWVVAGGCTVLTGVTDYETVAGGIGGAGGTITTSDGGSDCTNGELDGSETDVDCGGSCDQCAGGQICKVAGDCTTTFCVSGICCDAACTDICNSCVGANTSLADGTCGPAVDGTDPGNHCDDNGANTCGTDGACDGLGACRNYPGATPCGVAMCTGTTQTGPDACDGLGTCSPSGDTDCTPYQCGSATCKVSCTPPNSAADCAAAYYCNVAACTAKKPNGAACGGDIECVNGVCGNLVCRPATCGNMAMDGNETDEDCGGADCGNTCAAGLMCNINGDCIGNDCQTTCQ